ncbi:TetR/AcrR family transcriptional regulator [uncultured Rothia sp.]|uniref:TetR/AcrR family transcriptional regulator n=1 Tax=uncultured Rothia sp. TaxID=316088 RepID=UPI003216CBF9
MSESKNLEYLPFTQKFSSGASLIADAVISVIAEQGFDAISVRKVANRAKVASGTVQYHFPSKEALLRAGFIRSIQRQSERGLETRKHSEITTVTPEILYLLLEDLLPTSDSGREDAIAWVSFSANADSHDWLSKLYWQALELFQDRIIVGLTQLDKAYDLAPGLSIKSAAHLISALVNGLTIDCLNAPDSVRQELSHELLSGLKCIIIPTSTHKK